MNSNGVDSKQRVSFRPCCFHLMFFLLPKDDFDGFSFLLLVRAGECDDDYCHLI